VKLCTFEVDTVLGRHRRLGAVTGRGIVDLNSTCAWHLARKGEVRPYALADALLPPDMLLFLQGEHTTAAFAGKALEDLESAAPAEREPKGPNGETLIFPPGSVRLRAPLTRPASLRDFFSFEGHVRKGFEKRGEPMPDEWFEIPVYYKGNHQTIIGPDDDAPWPSFTERFDYELEIAAVIGRTGRNVMEEKARECIAGYTIMNDFSARDIQRKEMKVRLGPAKGKDWCTGLGPVLVTTDEIGDPYALRMTARVNGEVWSSGSTSDMHWTFEQMIAFVSRDEPLFPGDVLGSGTVTGGCGLELDRWVQPGDVVELEIEKIGVLRNRVVRR
jgi:2-keto-4-pentenoate hydratase/2-oxohepta-3-ene-1,7-dioic acid hydratase in catechol pathway